MYRITKKERGWIVEKQVFKYKFLGFHFCEIWIPFVKSSGLNCCWHHSKFSFAEMNLNSKIKDNDLIIIE